MRDQRQLEPSERSEQTRKRILKAAVKEFSAHGLAGARTDAIARAARANKALLYYYFKSKEALYVAAIEDAMADIAEKTTAILKYECSPGEHLLQLALNHFDRILTQHNFQGLMQQEMVRFRAGKSTALPLIARSTFAPLLREIRKEVRRGVRSGELVPMEWMQVIYSSFGSNVFYFLSAPMMRIALTEKSFEPFTPAAVDVRRKSAVQFLANAIFTDRKHGQRTARRVLAAMPMPAVDPRSAWRKIL
jgi:TetR/AcrR family transcriptional regulator